MLSAAAPAWTPSAETPLFLRNKGRARNKPRFLRRTLSRSPLPAATATNFALFLFGESGSNGPAKNGKLKKHWPRSTRPAKFAKGTLGGLRAKTVAAVELLARSDRRLAATTDQWDADPWLFNTPAGTVELITGKLREHRPQDYITKIAGCGPGLEGCPMFFKFMNKIFDGDQDLIDYLQKFFGYILTGLTSEHAMLFFHGAGANGKSVLVSTIAGILGEYHRVAPIDTFTATGFSQTLDRFGRAHGGATRDGS